MPASLGREKNGAPSVFFHLFKTDVFRVSLSFPATLLYCHFSLLLVPGYCSFQHEIVLLSLFLSPRIYGSHSRHNHLSLSAASIVYPSLISPAVSLRCAFDSPCSWNSSSSPDTCLFLGTCQTSSTFRSHVVGETPETRLLLLAINQQSKSGEHLPIFR